MREAATAARVSVATVERAIRAGELEAGGTPGRVLIRRAWLDAWLSSSPRRRGRRLAPVPGLVDVDVEARIRELVQSHRPELLELVDQALEHELARLVAERLAARNGNGAVTAHDQELELEHGHPVELCIRCGQRPRMRERRICRACRSAADLERRRRARAREHAPAPADDGPRPDGDP
jgi:excisionase family DNA binding protein